jgi:hypothetical protein
MPEVIRFTSNVTDCSTSDGYQFEFHCQRCGNGYRSTFRHSVTGFGGRLAALGGTILGGEIGSRIQQIGLMAQWNRPSTRGTTSDQHMVEAAADVAHEFRQCGTCSDWVCGRGCWDERAGRCLNCAVTTSPSYGAVAGDVRFCGHCGAQGSGRFCGSCGTSYDAPPCVGCGSPQRGTAFCQNCGTPAG